MSSKVNMTSCSTLTMLSWELLGGSS